VAMRHLGVREVLVAMKLLGAPVAMNHHRARGAGARHHGERGAGARHHRVAMKHHGAVEVPVAMKHHGARGAPHHGRQDRRSKTAGRKSCRCSRVGEQMRLIFAACLPRISR